LDLNFFTVFNATGTNGVAFDAITTAFQTTPSMNVVEQTGGTYLTGTFDIIFLSIHQTTVSVDASELDMRVVIDNLLVLGGYSSATPSSVSRIGPNRAGAYQWHIDLASDNSGGDIPLFTVNGDQLVCGLNCPTPAVNVTSVRDREKPWKQQLKLEASHSYETQHVTISSAAQVHEVQTLEVFATKGFFHLSLGSYSVAFRLNLLPISTLSSRVKVALQTLVGVDSVDVSFNMLVNTTMNVVVTFTHWNGDVPLISLNDTALLYETFDNGVFVGTIPAHGNVVETTKGIGCEEQAIELLDSDPTTQGYFTCTFGSDPMVSNPIAYDSSAMEIARVLSQLPLLGPVRVSLSPNVMSVSGGADTAVFRRWDITFANYVGSASSLIACTVGTASGSTSSISTAVRVSRVKYGEGVAASGTFGLGILNGASESSTAHAIGSATTAAVITTGLSNLGTAPFNVERQVYGYGTIDQYKYIVTWPISTGGTNHGRLEVFEGFTGGTLPSLAVDVVTKSTLYEVQTITSASGASNFVLSFDNQETSTAFETSSTALNIEQALNALSSVGVVEVSRTGSAPTVTWSITFVKPIAVGGAAGLPTSRTSHTKCTYNYEKKQCHQSYTHAHSCRQYDGISRSVCVASDTTNSSCAWDEGSQKCRQASYVVGDDFECRIYDGKDKQCGTLGYQFPVLHLAGTGYTVSVLQESTLSPLEGTFKLSHGRNSVRLPYDVTELGLKTSLENILDVGKVSVTKQTNPSGHPSGWGSHTWDIVYDEYSAIVFQVKYIDVQNPSLLTLSQEALITHVEVPHSHLQKGDIVHLIETENIVKGYQHYWTVVSVVSPTQFTINVLEQSRPGMGRGRYQHPNPALMLGQAIKEPTIFMDHSQIFTSGTLTASSEILQEGSKSCCASGTFRLGLSEPTSQLPGHVFALNGSPVVRTTEDLTENGLLFRGAPIKIGGTMYTILENAYIFDETRIVLDRNYENADSPSMNGDIAFYSEFTPMLALDASAVEIDTALSALSAFSKRGVSVHRSVSDKNAGFTWMITFFDSRFTGDVPLLTVDHTRAQDERTTLKGAGVHISVTEIIPGSLASIQSIQTSSLSKLSGTFTLTFRQETTGSIPYNATAKTMKATLEAMHNIGRVDVSRSKPSPVYGCTWLVTFLSSAGPVQHLLVGNTGKNTPGGSTFKGISSDDAVINVTSVRQSTTVPLGGTFKLKFRGQETTALPHDASAANVKTALEALPVAAGLGVNAGQLNIAVHRETLSNIGSFQWFVTFQRSLRNNKESYFDLPNLELDTSLLSGSLCTATDRSSDGCTHDTTVHEHTAGSYMSGAFRMSFGGQFSEFLPHNASADNVKAAVVAFNTEKFKYITTSRVDIRTTAENQMNLNQARDNSGIFGLNGNDNGHRYQGGYRWCIEFRNVTGDLDTVVVDGSRLEGAGVSVASEEKISGYERLAGSFVLTFAGETTSLIPYDASGKVVSALLESLAGIGSVAVTHSDLYQPGHLTSTGRQWNITFTSLALPSNLGPMPLMSMTSLMLTGTGIESTVSRVATGCCNVRVSSNGVNFTPKGLPYRFDAVSRVTAIHPTTGPARGGTILSVTGVGFWSGPMSCLFGEIPYHVEVSATRVDDENALCVTPVQSRGPIVAAHQSGARANNVFFGGQNERGSVRVRVVIGETLAVNSTSQSRSYFTYNARSRVTALVPKTGPFNGGTVVRIHGHNFPRQGYARKGVLCKFGDSNKFIVGVYLSASELECVSPSASVQSSAGVASSTARNAATSNMKIFVSVEVSFNGGIDFTQSGLQFWYRPEPFVYSVVPDRGPARGGTRIIVSGINFERSLNLACKFGNSIEDNSDSSQRETNSLLRGPSIVPAQWISSTSMLCVTPILESKSEVQRITVRSREILRHVQVITTKSSLNGAAATNVTSGHFRLSFGDYDLDSGTYPNAEITAQIYFNATSQQLKDKLEALPSIVGVDVKRFGPDQMNSYRWFVTFTSSPFSVPDLSVAEENMPTGVYITTETTVLGSNYGIALHQERILLTGHAPQSSIQEVVLEASAIEFAKQTITIDGSKDSTVITGTFSLKISNSPATAVPIMLSASATAVQVQEATENALSSSSFVDSVGSTVRVTRSHSAVNRGYVWEITFLGVPFQQSFTFTGLVVDTDTLSSGTPTVSAVVPPTFPLSGTYRLDVSNAVQRGQTSFFKNKTIELPVHASPSTVENALNDLLVLDVLALDQRISVVAVSTNVLLGERVHYKIIFPSSFGFVPTIAVESTLLTGTSVSSSVTAVQNGIVPKSSGFTLTVGTLGTTSTILHNALPKTIEHAIESLGAGVQLDVHVSRRTAEPSGYVWDVTFPETWNGDLVVPFIATTYVPILGSYGVADNLTVSTTILQAGTYQQLSGTFNLSFPTVATTAAPSTTPYSRYLDNVDKNAFVKNPFNTIDQFGDVHLTKVNSDPAMVLGWDASAATVETSLLKLPYVRQVKVTRSTELQSDYSGEDEHFVGYTWTVTFLSYGSYQHEGFVPLLEAVASSESSLSGNDVFINVDVLQEGNGPSVPVEVTNNGQQYTQSHETFQYHPSIVLGTIFPVNGPSIGGTKVIISLAEHSYKDWNQFQFQPEDADSLEFDGLKSNRLTCRFNNSIVPATVITKDSISCITPPHVIGNASVAVSLNGEDFSRSLLQYKYDLSARSLEISPLSGPITGGTVITVSGLNFDGTWNMDRIKCSFGSEIVSAFWSTLHQVKCRAPPVPAPRSISIEISTNLGLTFTNQKVQYYYEEIRHVSSVSPRVGPSTGNTLVTLIGGPFPNYTSTLFCRFGNQPVPAQFISESTVQCNSPPLRPVREVQSITIQPKPTSDSNTIESSPSGFFSLIVGETCTFVASGTSCMPQSTSFMDWNVSASSLKQVLESLPNIGTVRVTRIPQGVQNVTWFVTFMSDMQRGNVNQMKIANNSLYTSSYSMSVTTVLDGTDSSTGRVGVEVTSNGVDYTQDGVVFEYQAIVQVHRIYPTHGPLYGRTEIYVYGSNFRNTSGLYCHFGKNNRGSASPATAFINSTCIKCVAPPVLYIRSVRVEVSNNGANPLSSNQSTTGAWYTFDKSVKILNIYPKSGPSDGNTSVRVVGENFLPTDEMKCKFGSFIVRAVWLNGHELVCRTPSHTPGAFPLEITANDQDYTTQSLPYLFYSPVYMVNLDPVSGPAWSAGTALHIYGGNFFNTSTLTCRVADVSVPAQYLSDTEVVCYTPPCLNSYTGGACKMMYQPLSAQ